MDQALCIRSFRRLVGSGEKQYDKGVIYDIADLPKDTLKQFFEHPEVAPPKTSTRKSKSDRSK